MIHLIIHFNKVNQKSSNSTWTMQRAFWPKPFFLFKYVISRGYLYVENVFWFVWSCLFTCTVRHFKSLLNLPVWRANHSSPAQVEPMVSGTTPQAFPFQVENKVFNISLYPASPLPLDRCFLQPIRTRAERTCGILLTWTNGSAGWENLTFYGQRQQSRERE